MFELSKQFRFDAAHTLERIVDAAGSRRVHGHSYRAEVTLQGVPNPKTGMVVDLGLLERSLDKIRDGLDHHFLDDVEGLGPATLENLSVWIWRGLEREGITPSKVTVMRDSGGEACSYTGPD